MPWPALDDYINALQHPTLCFQTPHLQQGLPQPDGFGIPILVCGQFAAVSRMDCGSNGIWAVRLFQSDRPSVRERYASLSAHLTAAADPLFASFNYVEQGINVNGAWFPALLMEWVEGQSIVTYLENLINAQDTTGLLQLADKWRLMLQHLEQLQIAHGDLQHGNVRVAPDGSLRLIDYDGMWVPALNGRQSLELGRGEYQHPKRSEADFSAELDLFSGLVILIAIRALALDLSLWGPYNTGDNMLFRADDFTNPKRSKLFTALRRLGSRDPELGGWVDLLTDWCSDKHLPARAWLQPPDPNAVAFQRVEAMASSGDIQGAAREWESAGLDIWKPGAKQQQSYAALKPKVTEFRTKMAEIGNFLKAIRDKRDEDAVRHWTTAALDGFAPAAVHLKDYVAARSRIERVQEQGKALARFAQAIANGLDEDAVREWDDGKLTTFPPAQAEVKKYEQAVQRLTVVKRQRQALTMFVRSYYGDEWSDAVHQWRQGKLDTFPPAAAHLHEYERALTETVLGRFRLLAAQSGQEEEARKVWENATAVVIKRATEQDRRTYERICASLQRKQDIGAVRAALTARKWSDAVRLWDKSQLGKHAEANSLKDAVQDARNHVALNAVRLLISQDNLEQALLTWDQANLERWAGASESVATMQQARGRLEAGRALKALQEALDAHQWQKAIQLWESGVHNNPTAARFGTQIETARRHTALNSFLRLMSGERWDEAVREWERAQLGAWAGAATHRSKYEQARSKSQTP